MMPIHVLHRASGVQDLQLLCIILLLSRGMAIHVALQKLDKSQKRPPAVPAIPVAPMATPWKRSKSIKKPQEVKKRSSRGICCEH
jgi:hypothetical protein